MLSTIVAGFINIEIVEFFYQNYMIINYISYFFNIAGITQLFLYIHIYKIGMV
jgi:hypothetical protein